jgi:hypothetical protein
MGDGPSAIEVEMLEQERDLIAAELSALKEEMAIVSPFAPCFHPDADLVFASIDDRTRCFPQSSSRGERI